MKKNKVLIITGPTATGKTSQAVKLAQTHHGEIISLDSRQAYQSLDLLSGKDLDPGSVFVNQTAAFSAVPQPYQLGYRLAGGVPVWLVDALPPSASIDIYSFIYLTRQLISYLHSQRKLPIVTGGSVQYVHRLIHGLNSSPPPDHSLRKQLNHLSVAALQARLERANPDYYQSLNRSDKHNPRRLIRAIEKSLSAVPNSNLSPLSADYLSLVLYAATSVLSSRISARVNSWMKAGVESEVKHLLSQPDCLSPQASTTLGLSDWQDFLAGRISRDQLINHWQTRELQYARSQLTYLKKYFSRAVWIDISLPTCQNKITSHVNTWLGE